ncbi:unnamed protein product [Moneuplotes crassus]|uniref:EamA domain-containing protein n=1 Tax=Euplotes crassus TaxID=5936 RepID=A0AAD1UU19_EUPCR|nr:unnamed protein product [Moneuplotes crassus]
MNIGPKEYSKGGEEATYVHLEEKGNNLDQHLLSTQAKEASSQTKSIVFALLTGVFYALHNFTLGSLARMGYLARFNTGIGMIISAIIYYIYKFIMAKKNGEEFFNREESVFLNQKRNFAHGSRGRVEPWIVIGILVNNIFKIGGGLVVIIAFKLALESGLNQGIITSIFGMTPFLASLCFYCFFNEKLRISQVVGMMFMVGCIVCIGLGTTSHKSDKNLHNTKMFIHPESSNTTAYICIFLACICPVFFAIGGLIMRLMKVEFQTDPAEFTQVCYIWQAPVLVAVVIFGYTAGGFEFILVDFVQMVVAGMLVNVGGACFNIAVSCGNAGVAYSLINVQVIIFSVLAAVFLQQIPSNIEMLAGTLGIIGSCIMSIGPSIVEKIQKSIGK